MAFAAGGDFVGGVQRAVRAVDALDTVCPVAVAAPCRAGGAQCRDLAVIAGAVGVVEAGFFTGVFLGFVVAATALRHDLPHERRGVGARNRVGGVAIGADGGVLFPPRQEFSVDAPGIHGGDVFVAVLLAAG